MVKGQCLNIDIYVVEFRYIDIIIDTKHKFL